MEKLEYILGLALAIGLIAFLVVGVLHFYFHKPGETNFKN